MDARRVIQVPLIDRGVNVEGGSIAREILRRGDLARSWLLPFHEIQSSRVTISALAV